jgi:hypothetical protein
MDRVDRRLDGRSTGSLALVIVGGVLAFIGVAALATALVLTRRARSSASAAAGGPAPSSMPAPSVSPAASPLPVSIAPPAPLAPPAPPGKAGTAATSLRARPAWWARGDGTRSSPSEEYAPQLGKPLDAFIAAAPFAGDVRGAYVICRVQTFGHADTFAGDDVQARAAFGSMPRVAADGPEDDNLAFVSAPLATIRTGDRIAFEILDRDVFSLELITRLDVAYTGGPLTAVDKGAAIECRALAGDALDRQVAHAVAFAGRQAAAVRATKLQGNMPGWGWPTFEIIELERDVADVAALAGWDDPRVLASDAEHDATIAALETQRSTVFGDIRATASSKATLDDVTIEVVDVPCGRKKPPTAAGVASACVAQATIRNDGSAPLSVSSLSIGDGASFYTARATTGPVAATITDLRTGAEVSELSARSTLDVLVSPIADKDPALVGLCAHGRCAHVVAR